MPPALVGVSIGLVAGLVGGLFGVGGGVVVVPGLVLLLGFRQHRAHGTSLAAIVASTAAALVPFILRSEVAWDAFAPLLLGGLIGAVAGARVVGRIPAVWLARAFVALTVAGAIRLWTTV